LNGLAFYPYRFASIFKEKVWGGRALANCLGKQLPPNVPVGESWEISDREGDVSIVANGPHAQMSLRALIEADRAGVLGPQVARAFPEQFPLLVKYIDAEDILSLQVHPDDNYAMDHENGSWGKMEAWYIIHADPGAFIYRGTKPGTDRDTFLRLLKEERLQDCINKVHVSKGDVIFIPAGCLHAAGAGILFCEIQQNSDLTYRVYDWGRVGLHNKPRELHVDKALDVIDWELLESEEHGAAGFPLNGGRPAGTRIERRAPVMEAASGLLLECPKFAIERVMLEAGGEDTGRVADRFHIINIIDGNGTIICPEADVPPTRVHKGDTYLIPGALQSYQITTDGTLTALRSYVPLPGD